ncbi:hypothetical protein [Rubellicoccus peritrichatus]|uniref:Uncharacterized protein n=1 Tax=Rubellicoccus peritrichatus TaxID=3080537 RepID=A0AAQ3LBS8_9BACT|nr:hypothetical protein [Puniceicoccus sp. CR14]WOO41634.1 hypothetical protein RZN69_00940 [Puniceicoccus sp. CR14]
MNKTAISFLSLMLIHLPFAAGYYGSGNINKYSADGDTYYRAISEDESGGLLSSKSSSDRVMNIQVFDVLSGGTWKVFENNLPNGDAIVDLIFEVRDSEGNIVPDGNRLQNIDIKRDLKSKILIVVRNAKSGNESLWTAYENGKGVRRITVVGKKQDWHIDLKNQKIRVFTRTADKYRMDAYDW